MREKTGYEVWVGNTHWVWGVSGGDIRRSKEGEREGREDTSEGETSRFVPASSGQRRNVQSTGACCKRREGLALSLSLSLSLLMQVIFL